MPAADPTAAIASYLLSQVGSLVQGRVFRPRLPEKGSPAAIAASLDMPCAAIVIRPAGGYSLFGGSTLALGDPRLDIFCYGATELESQNIAREVTLALKTLNRKKVEHTLLHWARISGGPLPLTDPDTKWPYCLISAQVAHAEQTVA